MKSLAGLVLVGFGSLVVGAGFRLLPEDERSHCFEEWFYSVRRNWDRAMAECEPGTCPLCDVDEMVH